MTASAPRNVPHEPVRTAVAFPAPRGLVVGAARR